MLHHILAPTDFSKRSAIAGERALDLAALTGARLTLLHAVDDDQLPNIVEISRKEALAEFAEEPSERGAVKVDHLVRVGEPFHVINEVAEEIGADLLVMGAHRQAPLRNAFFGTTSERALRGGRLPALIVRRGGAGRYRKPYCALDLVHDDLEPWRLARALGIADEAAARIVFAYEAGSLHKPRVANRGVKDFEGHLNAERDAVLPSVAKAMTSLGLKPDQSELVSIYFSAADTVVDVATRGCADLLIVGSHRKSAFDRVTLGSVSQGVLRRAEMDVLVVPPYARK